MSSIAARVLTQAPPRFSLAGLSLGGYVALEIMRQAPERVSRLEVAQELVAGISGARLVVVPRCGHLSPLEQPQHVGDALLEWLETLW